MLPFALGLAFLVELAAIITLGYAGFHYHVSQMLRWVLGLGMPILLIIFWSRFMAPTSAHRLQYSPYRIVKWLIYAAAGLAAFAAHSTSLAIGFLGIALIDEILLALFPKEKTYNAVPGKKL